MMESFLMRRWATIPISKGVRSFFSLIRSVPVSIERFVFREGALPFPLRRLSCSPASAEMFCSVVLFKLGPLLGHCSRSELESDNDGDEVGVHARLNGVPAVELLSNEATTSSS